MICKLAPFGTVRLLSRTFRTLIQSGHFDWPMGLLIQSSKLSKFRRQRWSNPGLRLREAASLAIFVIVPIVAVALAHAFDFPHAAEIAMIALAISPLAALMPVNLIRVGRGFSFPVGLMAIVALLAVVVVPLLVAIVGRLLGRSSPVSPLLRAG